MYYTTQHIFAMNHLVQRGGGAAHHEERERRATADHCSAGGELQRERLRRVVELQRRRAKRGGPRAWPGGSEGVRQESCT